MGIKANDTAWEAIFATRPILQQVGAQGYSYVKADDLKRISGREPRLLAKLDTSAELPKVFKDNQLVIFPVRNGEYVIFRDPQYKTYFHLAPEQFEVVPQKYDSATDLRRFDSYPGSQALNEAQALDFAYVSSLLAEFTGDSDLHLTIRGRSFSGSFGFMLPDCQHQVNVASVQIEIDGGYESRSHIYLFEAKQGARADFHIRQLYYPYLDWSAKSQKAIVPIFMVITNGKYHFVRFEFTAGFGNLRIAETRSYTLNESPITRIALPKLLATVAVDVEPAAPFPQANDLDKVADLLLMLAHAPADKAELAARFEFDERQGDYYANAAAYLGFAQRNGSRFELTALGKQFAAARALSVRTELILEQMLKRPTFRQLFAGLRMDTLDLREIGRPEIVAAIRQHATNISESTIPRRASTVESWLRWVQRNCVFVGGG